MARRSRGRLYRDRGDRERAAAVALWLGEDARTVQGDDAIAAGWYARSQTLLEGATNPFVFESVEAFMTFFEDHYGPTLKARERLVADGSWQRRRTELLELFESLNRATDGSAHLESEYLLAVGRVG